MVFRFFVINVTEKAGVNVNSNVYHSRNTTKAVHHRKTFQILHLRNKGEEFWVLCHDSVPLIRSVEKTGFTNLVWDYKLVLEMPVESHLTFLMARACHQVCTIRGLASYF